jgi:hypothetical protein
MIARLSFLDFWRRERNLCMGKAGVFVTSRAWAGAGRLKYHQARHDADVGMGFFCDIVYSCTATSAANMQNLTRLF